MEKEESKKEEENIVDQDAPSVPLAQESKTEIESTKWLRVQGITNVVLGLVTVGLLVSTLYLAKATGESAQATERMAKIMHEQFTFINTPYIRAHNARVDINDNGSWKITIQMGNKSYSAPALDIRWYFIYVTTNGDFILEQRALSKGEPTFNVPFDYAPRFGSMFDISGPTDGLDALTNLDSLIVIAKYHVIFDNEEQLYKHGFSYESARKDLETLPSILRDKYVSEIRKQEFWSKIESAD